MITHIILWNAAEGEDAQALYRDIADAAARYLAPLAGIHSVEVWQGLRWQQKDHQLGLHIEMADRDALARYMESAGHGEFKKVIAGRVRDRVGFDAERP